MRLVSPRMDELHLTPLVLIDRIAALVPLPRTHWHQHRYFWCAGTELTAQGCGDSAAPGRTGVTDAGAGRVSQQGRGCAWGRQRTPNPGRTYTAGAAQAPSALPVGGADCQNLRGFSAAVPKVRWADAPDRLYYRGHAGQADSGSHRCQIGAATHSPGAWPAVVG